MCLAVVAVAAHPSFALVVAANRDEFHARPAEPAHWWRTQDGDELLAGRDLQAGGTWLGIDRRGRWAFVTNVREPGRNDPQAPSRGGLVVAAIHDAGETATMLADMLRRTRDYNGYNMIAGDRGRAAWCSNRSDIVMPLVAGVHGVSNAGLDTPWPKLSRVKAGLHAWIREGGEDVAPLFALLADRATAPDAELPATGVPLEWERRLSAPFIVSERYGTRCTTVLTIARDGGVRFVERSFDAAGTATGDVEQRFALDPNSA